MERSQAGEKEYEVVARHRQAADVRPRLRRV